MRGSLKYSAVAFERIFARLFESFASFLRFQRFHFFNRVPVVGLIISLLSYYEKFPTSMFGFVIYGSVKLYMKGVTSFIPKLKCK